MSLPGALSGTVGQWSGAREDASAGRCDGVLLLRMFNIMPDGQAALAVEATYGRRR